MQPGAFKGEGKSDWQPIFQQIREKKIILDLELTGRSVIVSKYKFKKLVGIILYV